MSRALTALRAACATGRDCQTVTVRRGHLRWLLREYDRMLAALPCSECIHVTKCQSRDVTAWCSRLGFGRTNPVSAAGGERRK